MLWVRADDRPDRLVFHDDRSDHLLIASPVGIEYYRNSGDINSVYNFSLPRFEHFRTNFGEFPGDRRYGDRAFIYQADAWGDSFNVGLPYWFICLITALVPAARLTARLRRKRPPRGLCPKCRYDLRAMPERCPECGSIPTKVAS